jgi:predicted metal-binding protein
MAMYGSFGWRAKRQAVKAAIKPVLHVFVCTNRRADTGLGPGCGERGEAVYDALKREVSARGAVSETWITKTHCLGICPRVGATIARYPPDDQPILTEVTPEDARSLLAKSPKAPLDLIQHELETLETLQRGKVLALARRLRPGLTLEDVQNPHDFPELADPDWHYADGVLAGIASVKSAIAASLGALKPRLEPDKP